MADLELARKTVEESLWKERQLWVREMIAKEMKRQIGIQSDLEGKR